MNDVVLSLDKYASGQIDEFDLQRVLARQLAAAPDTAPSILAAISAAERAGKIKTNDSRALGDWVRSTTSRALKGRAAKPEQAAGEPTVMRAPTQPEGGSRPRAPDGRRPLETVSEGAVLKDRYLLEKRIGSGGMGVVFRARDLEQQRIAGEEHFVAIKVLQPEFREHPDALKSLYEEVRKTRELAHPNIVGVYDCQQDGEQVFMTMQYLEGKTLEVLLNDDFARGMPWERARPIIEGMGSALAYAHDRGVIHCDFKPSNVFITLSGVPKVLDFGIARAVRGGQRRFDPGALGALTPAYASAEMIRAWQHEAGQDVSAASDRPDPRDDIFALACVVFELLTGQHPFDRRDAEQARQEQLTCPRVPALSASQNAAIAKAMAFDRDQRSARIEDFLHDLFSAPAPALAPAPAAAPPARRSWPWLAVAVAAAAAASVAVWGWLQIRGQPHPAQTAALSQPAPAPAVVAAPSPPAQASHYTVAVEVSGLTGDGLVIQDNGRDELAIKANGGASFATPLNSGDAYKISVLTQPSGQTCALRGNVAGLVANANVALTLNCAAVAASAAADQKHAGAAEAVREPEVAGIGPAAGTASVAGIAPVPLNSPQGLAFYDDRLYVANGGGNQVLVYAEQLDSTNELTALRQVATISGPDVRNPARLAFDSSGHLYVANRESNSVTVYDVRKGNREITARGGGALISGGSLKHPLGVAVDSSGNVYVANNRANSISIFKPNKPADVAAGFTEARFSPLSADQSGNSFNAPGVIADEMIGGKEFLLVGLGSENASDSMLIYAAPLTSQSSPTYVLSNAFCSIMPSGATGIARYVSSRNPQAPALYIASLSEGKVFRYAANDFAGGDDSSCPTAVTGGKGMNGPQGVAVDAVGNVFVANSGGSGDNANSISVYPNHHGLASTDVRPSLVYPARSQRSAEDQPVADGHEQQRAVDTGAQAGAGGRAMVNRVQVQADPSNSIQICPGTVNFTAIVDVHGVRRPISYRWVRSDGATSEVMSAEPGNGDSTVQLTDAWRIGAPGETVTGWARLDIMAPPLLQTNSASFHPRAEFTLRCRPNGPGAGYPQRRPRDRSRNDGDTPYQAPSGFPSGLPFNLPSVPGPSPRQH